MLKCRYVNLIFEMYCVVLRRGDESTYRADSLGRVRSRVGKTFVANMTEGDWTAYSIIMDEAFYDITLEVLPFSKTLIMGGLSLFYGMLSLEALCILFKRRTLVRVFSCGRSLAC